VSSAGAGAGLGAGAEPAPRPHHHRPSSSTPAAAATHLLCRCRPPRAPPGRQPAGSPPPAAPRRPPPGWSPPQSLPPAQAATGARRRAGAWSARRTECTHSASARALPLQRCRRAPLIDVGGGGARPARCGLALRAAARCHGTPRAHLAAGGAAQQVPEVLRVGSAIVAKSAAVGVGVHGVAHAKALQQGEARGRCGRECGCAPGSATGHKWLGAQHWQQGSMAARVQRAELGAAAVGPGAEEARGGRPPPTPAGLTWGTGCFQVCCPHRPMVTSDMPW